MLYYSHNSMTIKNYEKESLYVESAIKAGLSSKSSLVYVTLLEAGTPLSPKSIILKSNLYQFVDLADCEFSITRRE